MQTKDKLVVQDAKRQYTDILTNIDFEAFEYTWQKNSELQLDFTAYDDGSVAFNLLTVENSVWYQGQEYIVKQATDDWKDGQHALTVTATHVFYQLNYRMQHNKNAGAQTYTINSAMDYLLAGLNSGYSYVIHGNFGSKSITDFGDCMVNDGLSTILLTFNVYAYFPDNEVINLYDEASFTHMTDNVFRYRNNTEEVQLQYDSTTIVNTVTASSSQSNTDSNGNATNPPFQPFTVTDSDSVNRWGERDGADVSSDTITNSADMNTYVLSQMQSEPTSTITVTMANGDVPTIGDKWTLQVLQADYQTVVEVVQIQSYPFSKKPAQVVLNNLKQNFFDSFNANNKKITEVQEDLAKVSLNANQAIYDTSMITDADTIAKLNNLGGD